MRNELICILAVAVLAIAAPLTCLSADSSSLSGHASNDDVEITYVSTPGTILYITLAKAPTADTKVLVYSTGDAQTFEHVMPMKSFGLDVRALKEQTYSVLIADQATNVTLAEINLEIGYFDTNRVTLKAGEGAGSDVTAEVYAGASYVLPSNPFTAPQGKQFGSWQIGSQTYAPGTAVTVSSDIIATAQWVDIPSPSDDGFPVWIVIVIVAILLIAIVAVVFMLRRTR